MGFLFGDGGKKQAKAITQTATAQAAADREAARGAQLTTETLLAQDRASRSAAELLSRPQGTVDVDLESLDDNNAATRDSYSKANPTGPARGGSSGGTTRFRRSGGSGGVRI